MLKKIALTTVLFAASVGSVGVAAADPMMTDHMHHRMMMHHRMHVIMHHDMMRHRRHEMMRHEMHEMHHDM